MIEHVAQIFARGTRRRRVVPAVEAGAAAAGHACPSCGGDRVPQGDGHPRRVVRVRLRHARACCEHAPRARTGRPICTSKAPTSTAAGSTPRCWRRRHARRGAVPRPCSRTASSSTAGPQDVEVARQRHLARGRAAEDGAEILRLWVAAEDYRDDIRVSLTRSSTGSPRPTAGSATPSGSCSATSSDFDSGRDRAAVRGRWTRSIAACSTACARLVAACARLRGVRVPHGLPRGPQLLRGGPVRALPRRHQGSALHLARRTIRGAAPPRRVLLRGASAR